MRLNKKIAVPFVAGSILSTGIAVYSNTKAPDTGIIPPSQTVVASTAIETLMFIIEEINIILTQLEAIDIETAHTAVVGYLSNIIEPYDDIEIIVTDIDFQKASAGTKYHPTGADGQYTYIITLIDEETVLTTNPCVTPIRAAEYIASPDEEILALLVAEFQKLDFALDEVTGIADALAQTQLFVQEFLTDTEGISSTVEIADYLEVEYEADLDGWIDFEVAFFSGEEVASATLHTLIPATVAASAETQATAAYAQPIYIGIPSGVKNFTLTFNLENGQSQEVVFIIND